MDLDYSTMLVAFAHDSRDRSFVVLRENIFLVTAMTAGSERRPYVATGRAGAIRFACRQNTMDMSMSATDDRAVSLVRRAKQRAADAVAWSAAVG